MKLANQSVTPGRDMLLAEPPHAQLFDGGQMARRRHQNARVQQTGIRFWIRYRVDVLKSEHMLGRKEMKVTLGYAPTMTKRMAERKADEIMGKVNGQVYTIQSEVLFENFVRHYREKHLPTLSYGTRKKCESLLKVHVLPRFAGMRLCDVNTEKIQEFLNEKEGAGMGWWQRVDLKNLLHGIFSKADDWGYVQSRNPVAHEPASGYWRGFSAPARMSVREYEVLQGRCGCDEVCTLP